MSFSRRQWILLASICVAFQGVLAQPRDMPPAIVKVATARVQLISTFISVPAIVVSKQDARIAAETAGKLEMVLEPGVQVSQGDLLARLDSTALDLQIVELEAVVARETARLSFLIGEEKRLQRLSKKNNTARNELEQTMSNRAVAQADKSVAVARLAQSMDRLDRTRIRAPYDGTVMERLAQAGERVDTGDIIVRLISPDNTEVILTTPLQTMPFVKMGQQLDFASSGGQGKLEIRRIINAGNLQSHQYQLRLDLLDSQLAVGTSVRVDIPSSNAQNALVVPRDALVIRREEIFVFIVDNTNKAKKVNVSIGLASGADIEVSGTVSAGDQVVIRGNERLRDGQAVAISAH